MRCEESPAVSVIMGVRYQRPDTEMLERAIRSILEQIYRGFEFLICDDGSTAEAKMLLELWAKEDRRIRLLRDPTCLDLARKLNLCLREAKGQYIARMDDDDRSHPDRLKRQVQFLEENAGIAFVGCNVLLVRDGKEIGVRPLPPKPSTEDFYITQPYIHPALMFRREALHAVGGYSEDADCVLCEDYDLLLRMYRAGLRGANLQEVLLDYTVPVRGNRKLRHRINEAKTRYRRFRDLGKLPGAWPYVLKPVATGLLPERVRGVARKIYEGRTRDNQY